MAPNLVEGLISVWLVYGLKGFLNSSVNLYNSGKKALAAV